MTGEEKNSIRSRRPSHARKICSEREEKYSDREYKLTWAQGEIGVTRWLHNRNVYCFLLQVKILLWNLALADTAPAGTAPLARQQLGMKATPNGMIYLFGGVSESGGAMSLPIFLSWLLELAIEIWPAGAKCPNFPDINNPSQYQTRFVWGFLRIRPCNCHLDEACSFWTSPLFSLFHGLRCNNKRHFLRLCGSWRHRW